MSIRFKCPKCGAEHDRGYLDGVSLFRCLKCGITTRDNAADSDDALFRQVMGPRAMTTLGDALRRTQAIADAVRGLKAFDGHDSPPDFRPFVVELADELAAVIKELIARLPAGDGGTR